MAAASWRCQAITSPWPESGRSLFYCLFILYIC